LSIGSDLLYKDFSLLSSNPRFHLKTGQIEPFLTTNQKTKAQAFYSTARQPDSAVSPGFKTPVRHSVTALGNFGDNILVPGIDDETPPLEKRQQGVETRNPRIFRLTSHHRLILSYGAGPGRES